MVKDAHRAGCCHLIMRRSPTATVPGMTAPWQAGQQRSDDV
jgi:hypothetical protein